MSPKYLNILLIIASGVIYYTVVSPLYFGGTSPFFSQDQNIQSLTDKRNTYDKTIAAFAAVDVQAKLNTDQFKSISEEDRKKIFIMVPTSVDNIKLMSELTNIGVISGVAIDGMGIKDKGDGTYSISFSISTTYTNFKKIMSVWENSMRLFALQSVSFNPGKSDEEILKFNVELSAYYMK